MATRPRDVRRRLREKLLRCDPGLQEIATWHRWFVEGHTQRLKDAHLPPAEYDANLAVVTAQAAAMADKMRELHLSNRTRGAQ